MSASSSEGPAIIDAITSSTALLAVSCSTSGYSWVVNPPMVLMSLYSRKPAAAAAIATGTTMAWVRQDARTGVLWEARRITYTSAHAVPAIARRRAISIVALRSVTTPNVRSCPSATWTALTVPEPHPSTNRDSTATQATNRMVRSGASGAISPVRSSPIRRCAALRIVLLSGFFGSLTRPL